MATSRSRAGILLTTSSSILISPDVMSSRPASMRSAVDLPQPDGPTRTMNSVSSMCSERSLTATASAPNRFVTFSNVTEAICRILIGAESACESARVALRKPGADQRRRSRSKQHGGEGEPGILYIHVGGLHSPHDRRRLVAGDEREEIQVVAEHYRDAEDGHRGNGRQRHRQNEIGQVTDSARSFEPSLLKKLADAIR